MTDDPFLLHVRFACHSGGSQRLRASTAGNARGQLRNLGDQRRLSDGGDASGNRGGYKFSIGHRSRRHTHELHDNIQQRRGHIGRNGLCEGDGACSLQSGQGCQRKRRQRHLHSTDQLAFARHLSSILISQHLGDDVHNQSGRKPVRLPHDDRRKYSARPVKLPANNG